MIVKADINLVRSLSRKGERAATGLFVAEGAKLVGEVLDSGWNVERVFVTEKGASSIRLRPKAEVVGSKDMERMSHLKTPSDVLALVHIPRYAPPADLSGGLTLVLDGVQDPGNLGTIIRLADWFGIGDIICSPDTADCYNPKVVQATMGGILRVRVHYGELAPVIGGAASAGVPVYGTFLEGDNVYQADLTPTGLIVMGSEGRGIGPQAAPSITRKLYIPPYSPQGPQNSESLNVAVATAIICSEFRRRVL